MRANEFIVKENIFDKIGDAANKSVIAQQSREKANVRKKNVPGISKALHKILVAQVGKLSNSGQITHMVTQTLSKALKVDVTRHSETFGNSVDALISALAKSPESNGMFDLVQDVVDKSFDVRNADTEFSLDDLIEQVAAAVEDDNADLNKTLTSALKQVGYSPADIEPILKQLAIVLESTNDIRKALTKVLTNAERSDASKPTDADASTDANQQVDTELGYDPDAQIPGFNTSYGDLVGRIKEALSNSGSAEKILNWTDAERIEYIQTQLTDSGVTDENTVKAITKQLMNDPDLIFNYKLDQEFTGLVYSPGGTRYIKNSPGDNIAFVKHKDRWSEWVVGPNSNWKFNKLILDPAEARNLSVLGKKATDDVIPMAFRSANVEGTTNIFKVLSK